MTERPAMRNRCRSLVQVLLLCALLSPGGIGGAAGADEATGDRIAWHTGRRLQQELVRPVNIVLNRTTPRAVVQKLRELHHVALLLDRRIDPDQQIDVQFTQSTLHEALQAFALLLDGELAQIGATLFIGPAPSTDRIRTLIAVRTAEVKALDGDDSVRRQIELLRGATFSWNDLTEPAQLVDDVAEAFHVKRSDDARVPHDLWGAGVLADVNAVEALSLLLGEFDLTFQWDEQARAIRIFPAPDRVTVLQDHLPRKLKLDEALAVIRAEFPQLTPETGGRVISVAATVGEHDAIAELLAPASQPGPGADPSLGPLSRRRFTLTATRAEAIAILRTLETQGVGVQYDADRLREAGIDLQTRVSLKLDEATASELFTQLCEPLGLEFAIRGVTVTLSVKSP